MKYGKLIGRITLGALALSVIPYQIKKDKETGTLQIRSLLWGVRKTPGEEKDNYAFAILGSGLDEEAAPEADTVDAAPVEEEFIEESAAEAPAAEEFVDEPAAE